MVKKCNSPSRPGTLCLPIPEPQKFPRKLKDDTVQQLYSEQRPLWKEKSLRSKSLTRLSNIPLATNQQIEANELMSDRSTNTPLMTKIPSLCNFMPSLLPSLSDMKHPEDAN